MTGIEMQNESRRLIATALRKATSQPPVIYI
jgi:hypothetical protein